MSRVCTSLDQSRELMELGLDTNTADMFYAEVLGKDPDEAPCHVISTWGYDKFGDMKEYENRFVRFVPAWSLSVLMGLMPTTIQVNDVSFSLGSEVSQEGYSFGYDYDQGKLVFTKDHPIDAAYELIKWLLRRNRI